MKIQDLNSSFQYGMHGCGSYKGTYHSNSMEAMQYWIQKGVKIFEIDIAKTVDDKYVALAHVMNAHCLKNVEINPYRDCNDDKYSEEWFMRSKLCSRTTSGLTSMNLDSIICEMTKNPEIIVMFDLWGLWDSNSTNSFAKLLLAKASHALMDVVNRCVLEVYNKEMLEGIRNATPELQVMYCIHGTTATEYDEDVNPTILRKLDINIISYPWNCTKNHPGELELYHKNGFTIFSLSNDNLHSKIMRKAGVNVNLVDVLYDPNNYLNALCNKICRKVAAALNKKYREPSQEMTVDEVHDVALEMMKEIHEFCVANDIQYSLAYGSLLGAIRHKGFIPWDDDIDIWMTRPNFERFTKTCKSKKGYKHLSIYDKDSLLCFDRVYETDHTYVKNMTKACDNKTGVWIDIMLLDSVPDNGQLRNKQYKEWCTLNKQINVFKEILTLWEMRRYVKLLKVVLFDIIKGRFKYLFRNEAYKVHKSQLEIMEEYTYTHSKYCCFFQCGVFYRNEPQELLPYDSFLAYHLTKFEDTEFMIVDDYDKILSILFGDYMTPPPEDKRQKSHGICFWQ
ncbi:Phosphorylcholine metabolism protein LicD [Xylanibacter ruminicola]|uniref:LicD family protein n=1 Tax=Xylanibacter ruminicola TaxID=839 RepID=UPI0008F3BEE0|nr:LicD family protein [Xylanibacter ruminicola]SFC56229.1 Phosphorylcholine metabolism protein LicD [Xylanibacter ruminicola]